MPSVRTLLASALVAGAATVAVPAPADAGVLYCTTTSVGATNVGGSFTLIPPTVTPVVTADPGWYANCLLDTVGWCTFEYDPVGPYSQGLEAETLGYAGCLTS